MSNSHVQVTFDHGAYHCVRTLDGRDRVLVGCSHQAPRSAITHSSALTERFRGSDDASAPSSAADSLPPSERLSGAPNAAPPVADAGQGFGSAGVHPTLGL